MENSPVFLHLEESENVTRLLGQSPTCALTVTSEAHLNFFSPPEQKRGRVSMCNRECSNGVARFLGQNKGQITGWYIQFGLLRGNVALKLMLISRTIDLNHLMMAPLVRVVNLPGRPNPGTFLVHRGRAILHPSIHLSTLIRFVSRERLFHQTVGLSINTS